jgi:protein-tyrosine phosphatase
MRPVLISDGIYIGETQSVKEYGIKHVINLTFDKEADAINCPIDDSDEEKAENLLKAAKIIVKKVKAKEIPVYVHCRVGISRAPVVVAIALVLLKKFEKVDDALSFIKKVYPVSMPNQDLVDKAKALFS